MCLEIELYPLIACAFTIPAVLGHEILVLAEHKLSLLDESAHPARELIGEREIFRTARETSVAARDIRTVKYPRRHASAYTDVRLNRLTGIPQHEIVHRTHGNQVSPSLCRSRTGRHSRSQHTSS